MYNTPIELVIDILRNNPPRVFNDYLIKYSTTENEKIATVKYIHIKRPPKDIVFTENELNENGYKTKIKWSKLKTIAFPFKQNDDIISEKLLNKIFQIEFDFSKIHVNIHKFGNVLSVGTYKNLSNFHQAIVVTCNKCGTLNIIDYFEITNLSRCSKCSILLNPLTIT